jgi:hypothetical protein
MMSFAQTPEFRKVLWGGLAAWVIQGLVILFFGMGHSHSHALHAQVLPPGSGAVSEPATAESPASLLIAGEPAAPTSAVAK